MNEIQTGKVAGFRVPFLDTDFDAAVEAMRTRIEDKLSFDLINPKAWYYLGFAGGPVETFMTAFISLTRKYGAAMTPGDVEGWVAPIMDLSNQSEDKTRFYLQVMSELISESLVSDNIIEAFKYDPRDNATLPRLAKLVLFYGVGGSIVYLLLREKFFGRR